MTISLYSSGRFLLFFFVCVCVCVCVCEGILTSTFRPNSTMVFTNTGPSHDSSNCKRSYHKLDGMSEVVH